MPRLLTAALYKFVDLPDFEALQQPLRAACAARGIRGTLLLASEGINGTIAGEADQVRGLLQWLRHDPRLADLEHKESWADHEPFLRMKVRLKKEIVALHVDGLDPVAMAGTYVPPEAWNQLIAEPDVVLIDTRNDYEVAIGSFRGAVDPNIRSFSELPAWVQAQRAPGGVLAGADGRKPRVAMFCTGGIRCEKSTAYLRSQGFDEVYHLRGGILRYLETIPAVQSQWQGECFVFDERVSVGHGLVPGALELCRACRWPIGPQDKDSPLYAAGVSCPHCHGSRSAERMRGYAERHRQVELARARRQRHVGARPDQSEASSIDR